MPGHRLACLALTVAFVASTSATYAQQATTAPKEPTVKERLVIFPGIYGLLKLSALTR